MKSYRVWMLVLSVVALLIGSSAIYPTYSEANRASGSTTENGRQEVASPRLTQSIDSSQSVGLGQDGILNQFQSTASLKVARRGHTSTPLSDGRVAIIGGQNQDGLVSEVEILDTRIQAIAVVAALRVPRVRHSATALPDGSVFVAGGWDGKSLFDSTEIFDPEINSFSRGPRLQRPRAAHSATALSDGRVLIAGGSPDASAEILDPATNSTTLLTAKMTAARNFHGTALLRDGNVLIVGGVDPDGQPLRSAEVFDTRTQSFAPTTRPMRIKRAQPTLRVLPDGKVQIIGGDYDGTMEVFDPSLNVFGATAHLTPTADIFPTSRLLKAKTRAAFIDSKMALDNIATAENARPLQHYSRATKRGLDAFDSLLDRTDYSATEIPGVNRAVISGGVGKKGEYVRSVVVVESSPATVMTDKVEYLPGERPAISGTGWQPHEAIQIVLQEARPGHKRTYVRAVADEHGNLASGISVADFRQGVTFTLTAMGESSSYVAQTTYRDARPAGAPRPDKARLSIPILFRDASFELDEGLLVWEAHPKYASKVKPPETSAEALGFSHTFDFAGIVEEPCLGLGGFCDIAPALCPCPEGLDFKLKTGSFLTFSGSLDGDIDEDSASLVVSEGVSGKFIIQVTATGEIESPPIPIPEASIVFSAEIDDTGIGAEAALGIVARIKLTVNDPGTTFVTTLEFSESASVGFDAGLDGLNLISSGSISGNAGVSLVDTRGGCLKISIGPELSLSAGVDLKICEVGVSAGANVSPFIEGCFNVNLEGCPSYTAPISIGLGGFVEGSLAFCIDDIGDDFEFELARLQIVEFSGLLPETEPPVITCPASFTASTPWGCPARTSTVVNFPNPAVTDNCPGATLVCVPASGSIFPIGTTTVACTATDIWANTASCSFPLKVFNGCVQDDSSPSNVVLFNSVTGEYRVCMKGITYSGVGTVSSKGCVLTIQHNPSDRRVLIQTDFALKKGSASVQAPPGTIRGTITDRDISNNACQCAAP